MSQSRVDGNRFDRGEFDIAPNFFNIASKSNCKFDNIFFDGKTQNLDYIMADLRVKVFCESCGNEKVYKDAMRGEIICLKCGGVIEDHSVDPRGVRIYDASDLETKLHHEPLNPSNRPLIKVTSTDATTARRRARENNRIDWKYKKIIIMKIELSKVKSILPFSKEVEERAMEEITKVFNTGILRGRSAIPMAMALLYYSCIQCNSSLGLKDILNCMYSDSDTEEEKHKIHKAVRSSIRTLSKEFDYKFTIKKDYSTFLSKISDDLSIPYYACTRAIKLFKRLDNELVFSGDPIGYAGACLYHACKKYGEDMSTKVSQKDIASTIGMTEVTVRKRTKEVKDFVDRTGIDA
jgi:transcription initiation factor TFIIB